MQHGHPCFNEPVQNSKTCEVCQYNIARWKWPYRYQWASVLSELLEQFAFSLRINRPILTVLREYRQSSVVTPAEIRDAITSIESKNVIEEDWIFA